MSAGGLAWALAKAGRPYRMSSGRGTDVAGDAYVIIWQLAGVFSAVNEKMQSKVFLLEVKKGEANQ